MFFKAGIQPKPYYVGKKHQQTNKIILISIRQLLYKTSTFLKIEYYIKLDLVINISFKQLLLINKVLFLHIFFKLTAYQQGRTVKHEDTGPILYRYIVHRQFLLFYKCALRYCHKISCLCAVIERICVCNLRKEFTSQHDILR